MNAAENAPEQSVSESRPKRARLSRRYLDCSFGEAIRGESALLRQLVRDEKYRIAHEALGGDVKYRWVSNWFFEKFHDAARRRRPDEFNLLLAAEADEIVALRGRHLLHVVAHLAFPVGVRALLDRGAQPNARDECEATVLHAFLVSFHHGASHRDVMQTLEHLLGGGADVNLALRGDTPVHLAVRYSPPDVLERLLAAGADVNAFNADGISPAGYLLFSIRPAQMLEVLVRAGADLKGRNRYGETQAQSFDRIGLHQLADLLRCHGG